MSVKRELTVYIPSSIQETFVDRARGEEGGGGGGGNGYALSDERQGEGVRVAEINLVIQSACVDVGDCVILFLFNYSYPKKL